MSANTAANETVAAILCTPRAYGVRRNIGK